jgi:hypothetical protein
MIVETYFLVKIIHRIDAQNLHNKKSLPESLACYRIFSDTARCRAEAPDSE